ncbi:MAG: electron transport complex subunit RsxC [Bacteroidales bacterium]|jgi:electron transport complex protein RnfC|nr:electron transport complex subunit RsxC [Bacteroidales bacterium]MDD2280217.1 electron transport complex subunit RsxC [Bacteroidales bacterium]MDD4292355.1 electron transport complex subunit RsxC [Bacteroidales bacterium]MDD4491056.1 electron transport complex subunit RsxC [Bacteroidales bacterium]HNW48616.1 electron transport complex subunit RsxC [Bacteroidales bacterium]
MSRTFSIGGIHPSDNKISVNAAIENFPLMEMAYISLSQHLGAPAEPVVAKGDKVKTGQLIAKANGFISANVHSSVSGTVASIEPLPDLAGNPVQHIVIKVEGDDWLENINRSSEIEREIKMSGPEILAKIAECGVVGLGGAAFPTHIKLSPPPGKKAEYLIINGAECEPYLTSDYRLMLEQPEEILIGAKIMMKALNVNKCFLGIEDNKPKAIKKMKGLCSKSYPQIKVVSLLKKYPQGGEKQLIDAIVKRQVPSMGLPIDTGVVVQNVGTALAVYEAVQKNKPLFEGIVTVTGKCMTEQRNFRMRVGTTFESMIFAVGGFPKDAEKLISGGPMMGKAVSRIDASSVKSTSALLLLTEKETKRGEEGNCIRCAKCVEACPMGLEPFLLNRLSRAGKTEELEANFVQDCIECGSCIYTCPANIPLLDTIRLSKAQVLKMLRTRPKK